MSRQTVRSARGDVVDFDTITIKQQIANAPMNIEVARRKNFIDSKEGKVRGAQRPTAMAQPTPEQIAEAHKTVPANTEDFVDSTPVKSVMQVEAIPEIPVRKQS